MKYSSLSLTIYITNLLLSSQFDTSLGQCSIIMANEKINLLSYKKLIQEETFKLINEYGSIKKKPYQIIIAKNNKEFYKFAKNAPEWGVAITKSSENKIIIQIESLLKIRKNRFKEIIIHKLYHSLQK